MVQELASVRHERSQKDFPKLKLEKDEYVEIFISRAPICYLALWCAALLGIIITLVICLVIINNLPSVDAMSKSAVGFFAGIISIVLIAVGAVGSFVFRGNKIFVTNKRVMQFIMLSPVVTSYNVIDLSSIEDVSFKQSGIIQKILHIGTLRLSTVGDETTYTFPMSNIKPEETARIAQLVNEDKEKSDAK